MREGDGDGLAAKLDGCPVFVSIVVVLEMDNIHTSHDLALLCCRFAEGRVKEWFEARGRNHGNVILLR